MCSELRQFSDILVSHFPLIRGKVLLLFNPLRVHEFFGHCGCLALKAYPAQCTLRITTCAQWPPAWTVAYSNHHRQTLPSTDCPIVKHGTMIGWGWNEMAYTFAKTTYNFFCDDTLTSSVMWNNDMHLYQTSHWEMLHKKYSTYCADTNTSTLYHNRAGKHWLTRCATCPHHCCVTLQ